MVVLKVVEERAYVGVPFDHPAFHPRFVGREIQFGWSITFWVVSGRWWEYRSSGIPWPARR
jgi:hypothetical protein